MGWGMVRGVPLQPTRESGGASWAPQAGSGAEPQPKTDFGVFWRPQNAPFCIYMAKIWGGQFALASPTPNSGGTCPPRPPWSTPMTVIMPNISETVRDTFTKLSGFWGSSLGYPVQHMEGICPRNFWGGGRKVEPLIPYLQNGRPGSRNFLCSWGPLSTQK